jgi:hypothetical protein
MATGKGDARKGRYWQQTLGEAARSGLSIRQFYRRRRLKESQFYWWQRRLRTARPKGAISKPGAREGAASLALVSEDAAGDAGIELVLDGGRRVRITRGVDEDTLRTVPAAPEPTRFTSCRSDRAISSASSTRSGCASKRCRKTTTLSSGFKRSRVRCPCRAARPCGLSFEVISPCQNSNANIVSTWIGVQTETEFAESQDPAHGFTGRIRFGGNSWVNLGVRWHGRLE